MINATTIDDAEITKFSDLAEKWWDENGAFHTLHEYNPIRIGWIREKAGAYLNLKFADELRPFEGLKILDIGCGGGLLSEPMARLGAEVVGIDGSAKNIEIAKAHLLKSAVSVDYQNITVEELANSGEQFDIILNMEVIEHVANPQLFLSSCEKLLKPNGIMFLATVNRTAKSYALAIIGAEYVLRLLPRKTHDWKKFFKPSEINALLPGLKLKAMSGVHYNPIMKSFKLVNDVSVNYMMCYGR